MPKRIRHTILSFGLWWPPRTMKMISSSPALGRGGVFLCYFPGNFECLRSFRRKPFGMLRAMSFVEWPESSFLSLFRTPALAGVTARHGIFLKLRALSPAPTTLVNGRCPYFDPTPWSGVFELFRLVNNAPPPPHDLVQTTSFFVLTQSSLLV
jgi:hypothetical protein